MITAFFTTMLMPFGAKRSRHSSPSEKYSRYLSQQSAHHHFDSLCLALGVLAYSESSEDQADWLQRIADAAEKTGIAVEECISKDGQV